MDKPTLARLQRMIDKVSVTANAAKEASDKLMEWCRERYGFEPGDVDADLILDALGYCGVAGGMKAEDFDRVMKDNM